MDSLNVKDKLLKHIELANDKALKDIYDFAMRNDESYDSVNTLPKEVQELLLKSIADAESGRVIPNDEFIHTLRNKYSLPDL